MKIKKRNLYIGLLFVVAVLIIIFIMRIKKDDSLELVAEINPVYGSIQKVITTTGEVEPQNRLEIKPPIGGRIDKILVKEGDKVKKGDILALMSSTERAALLDAAHLKDKEELEYWKKVYNATPLIAPIDAVVIVRGVEPGQTVVAADPVIVLSNRLIVKAEVDETDIGEIRAGYRAIVNLDAYPSIKVEAKVDHISYESKIVNNVTIYEVDILPEKIPDVFRSGMSANVEIVVKSRENILLIPNKAVIKDKNETFVLLKIGQEQIKKKIDLGIADDDNVEVISGLSEGDIVIMENGPYSLPKSEQSGTNPFMPNFKDDKKKNK